jgi:HPt (histidine-containing phosphotransfer) domain-containing protein
VKPPAEELAELLADYRRALAPRIRRMRAHFAARRYEALRRELHSLAGSAGTFGLPEVGHAARDAESCLEAGGKGLGALLRRLEQISRRNALASAGHEGHRGR